MFISVIIPSYNREKTLSRAINSVLKQSFKNFELIIIDDGSTDKTSEMLDKFKDSRLTVIYQKNSGVSKARNTGIKNSKGNLIAFLDSDDIWLPEKLTQQINFMCESGFKITQTQEFWIKNKKRIYPEKKHRQPAGWFFDKMLTTCLVAPSCTIIERDVFERCGLFDENLPACEDYALWLKIGLKFAIGILPKRLTIKIGGHKDQLSTIFLGLDLYRIYAICAVLNENLNISKFEKLNNILQKKLLIYRKGCIKYNRPEEAQRISQFVELSLRKYIK